MDPVRVLAELSGLVVGRLVGHDEQARRTHDDDPFGRALLRLVEEGEPSPESGWRRLLAQGAGSANATTVLKRLTRDLLHGISAEPTPDEPQIAREAPDIDNIHSITEALQPTPAFEQANDGRWRPAAPSEEDLLAGYRPRTPHLGSRYSTTE
jgi:hypothetical protein